MSYQTRGSPLVLGADPCVADLAAPIRQFGAVAFASDISSIGGMA